MSEAQAFKYRAFLSYSHKDSRWGDWLHRTLERYQVPAELVSSLGVPSRLAPIFRDRYDMEAGGLLAEQIGAALRNSEALIVLCSPHAAKSPYVNEEIRRFKALGRGHRILPFIIDGEPGDPERECFPPALTEPAATHSLIATPVREAPLAADARPQGDGRDLAELKLIAGLIRVDLDQLRKREEMERRRRLRQARRTTAIMTVLALTAVATAMVATLASHRAKIANAAAQVSRAAAEERLDTAIETAYGMASKLGELRQQLSIPSEAMVQVLESAEGSLLRLGKGAAGNVRLQHRLGLTSLAFARAYSRMGRNDGWRQRAQDAVARFTALTEMHSGHRELHADLARVHQEELCAEVGDGVKG